MLSAESGIGFTRAPCDPIQEAPVLAGASFMDTDDRCNARISVKFKFELLN